MVVPSPMLAGKGEDFSLIVLRTMCVGSCVGSCVENYCPASIFNAIPICRGDSMSMFHKFSF
jgi:hypothetical protein